MSIKFLQSGLIASFLLASLFVPVFQVQAVAIGDVCDVNSTCAPYTCINGNPATPAPDLEGRCTGGPCAVDTDCAPLLVGAGTTSLNWNGAKCSGSGVCLETPGTEKSLPATPPASTGAGLLTLVDTITNWFFAIFTVLTLIFILLAAFQFVTAGGDEAKLGEARQKLIWAAVGIMVALISKGLVPIIRSIVGG